MTVFIKTLFEKRKKLPVKYFMGFMGFVERKVVKNLEKALLFFANRI